jgi:hypothetical protein
MNSARMATAIATGLVALTLIGCEKGSGEYEITFPEGWEPGETTMMNLPVKYARRTGATEFAESVNVVVEKLPSQVGLDDYIRIGEKNMRKGLHRFRLIERSRTTLNGQAAERWIYTHEGANRQLKVLVYQLVRDRYAYIITCTASADSYDEYEKTFEESAATFRIKEE